VIQEIRYGTAAFEKRHLVNWELAERVIVADIPTAAAFNQPKHRRRRPVIRFG
jgi:hypothetical protein